MLLGFFWGFFPIRSPYPTSSPRHENNNRLLPHAGSDQYVSRCSRSSINAAVDLLAASRICFPLSLSAVLEGRHVLGVPWYILDHLLHPFPDGYLSMLRPCACFVSFYNLTKMATATQTLKKRSIALVKTHN